jgi:hypothetical protein
MSTRRAKRLKLQPQAKSSNQAESLDKTATDPLEKLVPDVHDLIFQYLSASDVKNCFLVSKSWKQSLHNSRKTMLKFKFVMTGTKFNPFPKEISEFLENLDVRGSFRSKLKFPCDLKFSKLKELKLSILGIEEVHSILRCTTDCLLELKIGWIKWKKLFSVPMPPITAKLVSLDMSGLNPDGDQQHLKDFLSTMSSSLKSLSIKCINHAVFEFILEMEALEVLEIDSRQLDLASGSKNRTITTLKLKKYFDPTRTNFSFVGLRAFENLQTLHLNWCYSDMLQNILRECRDGQEVRIGVWIGTNRPRDVYEDLIRHEEFIARNVTVLYKTARQSLWSY